MRRKWIPDRAIEGPEVGGDGDGGRGGMGAVGCVVPAEDRWRAAQVREATLSLVLKLQKRKELKEKCR